MKSSIKATAVSSTILASTILAALATVPFAGSFAADAGAAIDEVIVTAQKRAQNVQEVPLAVQVLGGKQLTDSGVQNFADLALASPTLVIRNDVQPVNATVAVRGIGTNAFGIGVEPSVAVVVDDVPLAFQARAFSDLNDIERLEVLRGPQSTLYGKSASAGLINIVTANPTSTLQGNVGGIATGDSEKGLNGALSGPLSSTLGFRVSVNYDNFDGNVKNVFNGSDINGFETLSARGKVVWDPTSNFSAVLGADYIKGTSTTGRPFVAVSPKANLRGNPALTPAVWDPGISFGPTNTSVSNDFTTSTKYSDFGQSLKMTYDFGGPSLMSITSHAHFAMDDHQDSDESAVATLNNQQIGFFHNNQTTEELRLVSPGNQPFRYTAGLFYADVTYTRDFIRGPFFSLARWYATEGSQQKAGFGQLEYDLLPELTLIGGFRFGQEDINYSFLDHIANNTQYAGSNSDSYTTYKGGLQYQVSDDIMLFFTTASGHKGETYDLTTGFNKNRALAGPVLPETSTDYEIGARAQFFGHRLTFNPTIFTTDYSNFQAQGIQVLPDGTTNFRLSNVGSVRTRGIEFDSTYKFDRNFTVGVSGAYLDAVITSFPAAQCYPLQTAAQGCTGTPTHQNLAGVPLPDAPKYKFTGNFDYAHALGSMPFEGVLRGSYAYQTKMNYSLTQDPQTVQGAFGILNLSVGLRDLQERYELTAFVNNATNEHYYASMVNSASQFSNQQALQVVLPRDFSRYAGVRLSAKF